MESTRNSWKTLNKIMLWILVSLCVLSTIGLLNFGHGLGNIFFIFPIILCTLTHAIITSYSLKRGENSFWIPMIFFFGIICILIVYKSTVGRGPEFRWNGIVFYY